MLSHMRQYRGETTCPCCLKEFTLRYNLRRHMMMAHQLTQGQVNRLTRTGPAPGGAAGWQPGPAAVEHVGEGGEGLGWEDGAGWTAEDGAGGQGEEL